MSEQRDIDINLRAHYNKAPAQEAKKDAEDIGKASKQASSDGEKAAEKQESSEKKIHAFNSLLQGDFSGLSRVLASMSNRSKDFATSLKGLSVGSAVLGGLVAVGKAVYSEFKKAAEVIDNIKTDNLKSGLATLADEQARWNAALERSKAEADAYAQYQDAMVQANRQLQLSMNDLAKQKELATAKDDDERARIENKYAAQANKINQGADAKTGAAKQKKLLDDAQKSDAEAKENETARDEALATARKFVNLQLKATERVKNSTLWKRLSRQETNEDLQANIAKNQGMAEQANSQAQSFDDAAKVARQRAIDLRRQAQVQSVNNQTTTVSASAQDLSNQNELKKIDEDKAKADAEKAKEEKRKADEKAKKDKRNDLEDRIAAANRRQEDAEERFKTRQSGLKSNVDAQTKEYDAALKVAENYRKKGDKRGYEKALQVVLKERAEAEAATQDLHAAAQQSIATINGIKREVQSLRESLRHIDE